MRLRTLCFYGQGIAIVEAVDAGVFEHYVFTKDTQNDDDIRTCTQMHAHTCIRVRMGCTRESSKNGRFAIFIRFFDLLSSIF